MNDEQMTVIDDQGNETVATILFTHEHEGKKYVVFEFEGQEEISAAIYIPSLETEGEGHFEDITTDEEWAMLEELLEHYLDEEDIVVNE